MWFNSFFRFFVRCRSPLRMNRIFETCHNFSLRAWYVPRSPFSLFGWVCRLNRNNQSKFINLQKTFSTFFEDPFSSKKLFFSLTQISYLGVKSLGHWRLKVTVTQQNRFSTGLWLLRHFFRILNLTKWPIFHQTIWVDFLIFCSIFEIFSFWDFWRFSDAACSIFWTTTQIGDFWTEISRNQLLFSLKSLVNNLKPMKKDNWRLFDFSMENLSRTG